MDSVTLWIYAMMGIIVLIIAAAAFRGTKTFLRLRRPFIKTPKFRGKSILVDDVNFGRAVVAGVEKTAPNAGFVHLISQNGILFKQHYSNFQVEPVDNLEAMAGAERPVWRVKGVASDSKSRDKIENEAEIQVLADKIKRQAVNEKIAVNEAATLKDTVMDIFKELKETQKQEGVKIIK